MKGIIKYLSAAFGCAILTVTFSLTAQAEDSMDKTAETTCVITETSETTSSEITTLLTEISTDSSALTDTTETTIVTTPAVTTTAYVYTDITLGWNKSKTGWFYYDGKKLFTGQQQIDGIYYLFSSDGILKTGWQTVNSIRSYFDPETHSPVYGWIDYNNATYYNHEEKGKLIGKHEIDGKEYVFNEKGVMQTGFAPCIDGFVYYCGDDGAVIYGDTQKTPVLIGEDYYIISPKGYILCGWQTINQHRYFYDYKTGYIKWGWVEYSGKTYYVDKLTGKYAGMRYIGNYPYKFEMSGILCTGIQYFGDAASYFYNDGTRAVSKMVYSKEGNFLLDENGFAKKGWQEYNNYTYYFDDQYRMVKGSYEIDGKFYFFDPNGRKCTGLTVADNTTMYNLDEEGVMQYGWANIDGKRYYFKYEDGKAALGWEVINGHKYYFDKNFSMVTDKYQIGKDTYYFGTDGKMKVGWQVIDNEKYYFNKDKENEGAMYTYRHNIDGKDYLFYSTGAMCTTGNQKIAATAYAELGQEGGKPYWTWWGFSYRIEWCACFVSWCAEKCGYTADEQSPKFISCKVGIEWFKEHNQWKGRNYIPKTGDYIFFDWEPDGAANHIGIVDYYEDGFVYTIEGNSNDKVRRKAYAIDSKDIFGFAAPDFPQ